MNEGVEVPYPVVPSKKEKDRHLARFLDIFRKLEITMPFGEALQQMLSQPTLLRVSEARHTGASSIGGKCVESPLTFIERKTLEKPKETGHEEYSRFGSYLYV